MQLLTLRNVPKTKQPGAIGLERCTGLDLAVPTVRSIRALFACADLQNASDTRIWIVSMRACENYPSIIPNEHPR